MNKSSRMFVAATVVLAGALLASALMQKFTPNGSWLAFAGWTIFFVAVQSPMFMFARPSQGNCTTWLTRFARKE